MKRFIKILATIILAAAIYSLIPVTALYLQREPTPYSNEQAVEKLKGNVGDYFGFIVLGDNHAGLILDDSATLKLIRHINREDRFKKLPIDFAVIAGDLTFRGSVWDYRTYNKIRSLIKLPVISAIGNHDSDEGGLKRFEKYIGKKTFSFANRNSYFIIIDNRRGDLTEQQFADFEEELKKSSLYKHKFIVAHKTPFSPYQQSWYRPELNPWSYRFMKLCQTYKVDVVFSGHEHMFKDQTFGGVKYLVSGGGGIITHIPKSDGGFLHYIVVRVCGDYVDYEVRRIFPPLWEALAYYMWKDLFYFLKGVFF